MMEAAERLQLHEWDWRGKTQRAVVGEQTGALAFHYRKADREAVEEVVRLANAALATPDRAGLDVGRLHRALAIALPSSFGTQYVDDERADVEAIARAYAAGSKP